MSYTPKERYTESELSVLMTTVMSAMHQANVFVTVTGGKVYIECDESTVNKIIQDIDSSGDEFKSGFQLLKNETGQIVGVVHDVTERQSAMLVHVDI